MRTFLEKLLWYGPGALTAIFVILKLTGYIHWAWPAVFLPIIVYVVLAFFGVWMLASAAKDEPFEDE